MRSVLAKAKKASIVREPFPYLVLENALDEELCARLIAEYPELSILAQGREPSSNQRFTYPANLALHDSRVSALWKDFLRVHLAAAFWMEIAALFGDEIRRLYPSFERELGRLEEMSLGVRNRDEDRDVLLDAQICANAPVTDRPSPCRPAHVDAPRKLFAGLFYLRRPEDASRGGDLQLLRAKDPRFFSRSYEVEQDRCEEVRTIEYASSVLVFWINSPLAFHGTNFRGLTNSTRLLFNLVGEIRKPLFDGCGPGARALFK